MRDGPRERICERRASGHRQVQVRRRTDRTGTIDPIRHQSLPVCARTGTPATLSMQLCIAIPTVKVYEVTYRTRTRKRVLSDSSSEVRRSVPTEDCPVRKKAAKRVVKKARRKRAVKKAVKKRVVRKAVRRRVAKKAVRRRVVKKAVKRRVAKKAIKRRVVKKAVRRRVVKKAVKRRVVKKAVRRRVVKKAVRRRIVKKAIARKLLGQGLFPGMGGDDK